MTGPILIIGGTGKSGARVADRLVARGRDVRIGSRSGRPAFDWSNPRNWPDVVRGASAAYITYHPDIALPGAVERVEQFISVALLEGVRRLVLLTGRGEEEAQRAEQVLIKSGADWTIVRASWFAQNFSEGFFAESIMSGIVKFPREEVREPFIDVDDIADVVVEALLEDRHIGELYEVTGPRLLTFRQAFSAIAEVTGKPVQYEPVAIDEYLTALRAEGVPDDFVALLELLTREVLDGRNECTANGVNRALGRDPKDFSAYVADAAAAGSWS